MSSPTVLRSSSHLFYNNVISNELPGPTAGRSDGAAGFQKTEGGASRRQISEDLVRFSSFHHDGQRSISGRWRSDGAAIELQMELATGRGRRPRRSGVRKMVLANVGILEEGATLTYERQ